MDVTRGKPVTLVCPPREKEGFGAQYSWQKKTGVFQSDKRKSITPEGNMHIMYVTEEDINFIQSVQGIQCRVLADGSYQDSKNINVREKGPGWCRYFLTLGLYVYSFLKKSFDVGFFLTCCLSCCSLINEVILFCWEVLITKILYCYTN